MRRRKVRNAESWKKETVYAITTLTAETTPLREIAAILRRHWAKENELHRVRDGVCREDDSRVRTGQGPAVMATIRNLVLSIAHLTGVASIASWTRSNARNAACAAALLSTGYDFGAPLPLGDLLMWSCVVVHAGPVASLATCHRMRGHGR